MQTKGAVQILWFALALPAFLFSCTTPLRVAQCAGNPAQDLLDEINEARARENAPPLWADVLLAKAAEAHAQALAAGEASGHFGPDGSDPLKRIEGTGYLPRAFGETIAMGSSAPRLIVEAWLLSPGHRQILLDHSYKEVGLGGVLDSDNPIWVASFGSELEPPKTKCHPWPFQKPLTSSH